MKVATWNVNGLRARLDFIKLWLADRQPDIFGMQELKVSEEEFPVDEFRALGYEIAFVGQPGWNGVGILSREPIEVVATQLPGEEDQGARLISANTAGIHFCTVYVPNGKDLDHPDFPRKLAWLDSLAAFWSSSVDPGAGAILCGDFNVVHRAIDSWRGEAGDGRMFCTEAERARLDTLLTGGMFDLFRERCPGEEKFSWWDYRGGAFHRGQGLRIDLVLGTESIRDRAKDVIIDRDYRKKQDGMTASDHAPVILEL